MVELIHDARNIVGESAVWDDRRGRLVWVDIIGRRIHALDPESREHQSSETPGRVTSIGLHADGSAIVGLERHIALWDWTGPFKTICEVEPDMPDNRLNEGAVGPDGAYWVGTMQNNIGPDDGPREITRDSGRLWRLAPDGILTALCDDRFGITNTLVWPAPGQLITADTLQNALYRYRIEPDTGKLADRETVMQGFARGLPDGSCLDNEGMIWTARVAGGACLTRMTPEGELLDVIELPCSWPTSCTFGGSDLRTLFVTSARFSMTPEHLASHPHEGGLFAFRPGMVGTPANRFGS